MNDAAVFKTVGDQPKPRPARGDVWLLVLADRHARRLTGIERYGTPVQPFNGRDSLVDAYQEALDLVVYLRQRLDENHVAQQLRNATLRALAVLETPHKHDRRPDLVLCGAELDAIGILRAAVQIGEEAGDTP